MEEALKKSYEHILALDDKSKYEALEMMRGLYEYKILWLNSLGMKNYVKDLISLGLDITCENYVEDDDYMKYDAIYIPSYYELPENGFLISKMIYLVHSVREVQELDNITMRVVTTNIEVSKYIEENYQNVKVITLFPIVNLEKVPEIKKRDIKVIGMVNPTDAEIVKLQNIAVKVNCEVSTDMKVIDMYVCVCETERLDLDVAKAVSMGIPTIFYNCGSLKTLKGFDTFLCDKHAIRIIKNYQNEIDLNVLKNRQQAIIRNLSPNSPLINKIKKFNSKEA